MRVPNCLKDILNSEWILDLICQIEYIDSPKDVKIHTWKIQKQPNSITEGGVLSDICKICVHFHLFRRKQDFKLHLFIKIVPTLLRSVVTKNRLFEKEITFYSQVLPTLQLFWNSRLPGVPMQHFRTPKFFFGNVNKNGEGVLVLEDIAATKASSNDILGAPTILGMELDRLSASILALAEFHGLCMAYDLCSENNSTLEEKFPVFKNENLMWIQPDMLHFLRNVSQNAQKFLYNLKPQEKALHQRFSKAMQEPSILFENEFSRNSQWKCLQHGDSWPNNFIFYNNVINNNQEAFIIDWQVAHFGLACTDLCYLIYSSTSFATRSKYLDHFLRLYYDTCTGTIANLGIAFDPPTFEDLFRNFVKSIPICILFCVGANDFDENESMPIIATDAIMEAIDTDRGHHKLNLDKSMTKSIRLRNFIDMCKEAIFYQVL